MAVKERLLPALDGATRVLCRLETENEGLIKSARTHLQDAVPIAFSQEIYGWRGLLNEAKTMIENSLTPLCSLAIGATAVGTGLNAPKGFGDKVAELLAEKTGIPFVSAKNKFHALSSKDAFVFSHGALKALAANLMKLANDIRWLASGPRVGLGEIAIPEMNRGRPSCPAR